MNLLSMIKQSFLLLLVVLALVGMTTTAAEAQILPEAVRQELSRQNLSETEARALASQLGIDLEDPVQAAQRARELGVSEEQIQRLLRAVDRERSSEVSTAFLSDSLAAVSEIDSLRYDQLVRARFLRDSLESARVPAVFDLADDSLMADPLPYFGYDLFENIPEAFEPTPVGPVDDGYLVGPGDELRLSVWGAAEFQYSLPVDAEGRIFVERVGQITVAGKRLDVLREDVLRTLSRSYNGLVSDPPTVFMDLTVARLRPMQIFVLGEVARPGGYTVSSNSTLFNVLYSIGGPLRRGSLRSIDVIRNGRNVSTLDLYEYLLQGFGDSPIRLQNNDFAFVRPRGKTVAIRGDVVRPAIYEMVDGENFSTLLDFAGGLTSTAYGRRFQIERIIPMGERTDPSVARTVLDLNLEEILSGATNVTLQDGDIVSILSISDRVDNAVIIAGAVFQPGQYELSASVRTVRDLLLSADGLVDEAWPETAALIRLRDDFSTQQITIDLQRALADEPTQNIPLMRRDSLRVFFRSEVQEESDVSISGRVRTPATLPWREDMTVSDLLFAGGGLQDSLFVKTVFLERADLFRMTNDGFTTRVIPFNLEQALSGSGMAGNVLQPGDEIRIYSREVERLTNNVVYISGAVRTPGDYTYREDLTLEDLILQAGGFTSSAFVETAEVSRMVYGEQQLTETISVPLIEGDEVRANNAAEIHLKTLFAARSVRLLPEDRVYIRTDPNLRPQETVLVSGEVRFPGLYAIERENETLSSIMGRAGGVLPTGYTGGTRLIRGSQPVIANFDVILAGNTSDDIPVLPGDQIYVPRSPNTVEVRGNVNNPGLIVFERGRRVRGYLDRAGGLGPETADIFVTQADGATFKIRRGLFPSNPRVDEGGIITVTAKPPREPGDRIDVGKVITDTVSITGTILTAIILASRL